MDVREARRITGRHLLIESTGAAAELTFGADEDVGAALAALADRLREAGPEALGLAPELVARRHPGGASVAFAAPPDRLTAAATLLEWAAGGDASLDEVREERAAEADPALLRWYGAGLPVFHDDEGLTLGLGCRSATFPLEALPSTAPAEVGRVALVFVTGTNGKTTTTRLLARMGRSAGEVVGHTSSDGVVIDGEWVERGDWTGPGAARRVLRDPRVTLAALETARGGLMRRGLVVDGADVAVVTNVSADHLGEWGLYDVDDMVEAKLMVARALRPGGVLVANRGCAPLVAGIERLGRRDIEVRWFADGGGCGDLDARADDDALRWGDGTVIVPVAEVPVTVGGAARHNVENALAAALAARALGLPDAAVAEGLRTFRPSVDESRGRLNRFRTRQGAEVVLDFAHNPHGVARLGEFALRRPARRRLVVLGQAGDRSDDDILALAAAAARLAPDRVVVKELVCHLRGRPPGEVPAILRRGLLEAGLPPEHVEEAPDELSACERVLAQAGDGDLVLYLVHGALEPTLEVLAAHGAEPLA